MEIRKLKTSDLFKVASIIAKVSKETTKEIADMGENAAQIGITFVANALKYAETDAKEWLADLAQMTVEQFDNMHFDAAIDIIEHLAEKENLQSFLQRVIALKTKFMK